jgi:hypothetical protein
VKKEMDDDLGTCCACGCKPTQANPVRSLVFMDYKRPPGSGSGWGCFQCGLPAEGAVAVLCDRCVELARATGKDFRIVWICAGEHQRGRLNVHTFEHVPHDHDMAKHPEAAMTGVWE